MPEGFAFTGHKPSADRNPRTAVVVRSDHTGVWAAAIGGDTRHPTGPCRGAWRHTASDAAERLPTGTVVLLIDTPDGPWVAGWEPS